MFNCDKCLHKEVCDSSSRQMWAAMAKEDECSDFKDGSNFVEVVRCHNCEYHGIRDKCPLLNMSPYRDDERGYCSEGKRLE